jgi:predicted transcriptional regulator
MNSRRNRSGVHGKLEVYTAQTLLESRERVTGAELARKLEVGESSVQCKLEPRSDSP